MGIRLLAGGSQTQGNDTVGCVILASETADIVHVSSAPIPQDRLPWDQFKVMMPPPRLSRSMAA
jgi:hypothetical protein